MSSDAGSSGGADVLILSLLFPPDGVSTAHIMGELATDLRDRGHRVRVLTTTPHYSQDAVARAAQPMTPVAGRLVQRSDFHGIPVTHIAMPPKRGLVLRRMAAWIWFHLAALLVGRAFRPRPAVILVPSPLLSLAVVAWLINLGRRATYIYNVQELYPDILINLGQVRNGAIIAALRRLERFVYRKAAAITTIGPTLQRRIAQRAPGRPVVVIPNPADVDSMRPLPKDNGFARQHDLLRHVIVSYAGNMGLGQGLDQILAAARHLRASSSIRFLFVGEGIFRAELEAAAHRDGLHNVVFLPQQPYAIVPQIYAASDICLVPLIGAMADEAIPSKVARIMACARPVLAIAPRNSDLARLVDSAGCGRVAPPEDPGALAAIVAALAGDAEQRQRMGACGREYACAHLSRSAVAAAYDRLVRGTA